MTIVQIPQSNVACKSDYISENMSIAVDFLPCAGTNRHRVMVCLFPNERYDAKSWSQYPPYKDLRGIAKMPEGNKAAQDLVVRRMSENGVTFLNPDQAEAYMSYEGQFWVLYYERRGEIGYLPPNTWEDRLGWMVRDLNPKPKSRWNPLS